eukprot:10618173-Karenia_brevis.AAC.1
MSWNYGTDVFDKLKQIDWKLDRLIWPRDEFDSVAETALGMVGSADLAEFVATHAPGSFSLAIYFDGSWKPDRLPYPATWAFDVIACVHDPVDEFVFIGGAAGPVVNKTDDWQYLGIDTMGSCEAELSAAIWSLAWAVWASEFLLQRCHVPVFEIYFDNQPVGMAIFDLWSFKGHEAVISNAVAMSQYLSHVATVAASHVHSHENQPWNQVADRLCAQEGTTAEQFTAHLGRLCGTRVNPFSSWLLHDKASQWALAWMDPVIKASLPHGGDESDIMALSRADVASVDLLGSDVIGAFLDDTVVEGSDLRSGHWCVTAPMNIMSANALSLRRESVLRTWLTQLDSMKIGIACCQETRPKRNG